MAEKPKIHHRYSGKTAAKVFEYSASVYLNDDVYTTRFKASRIALTDGALVFYDAGEHIVAVFPAHYTVIEKVTDNPNTA